MKAPTAAQLLLQQDLLDRLYVLNGRDDPEHPFHMTYSGLGIRYRGAFDARQEDWATDETITQEES